MPLRIRHPPYTRHLKLRRTTRRVPYVGPLTMILFPAGYHVYHVPAGTQANKYSERDQIQFFRVRLLASQAVALLFKRVPPLRAQQS